MMVPWVYLPTQGNGCRPGSQCFRSTSSGSELDNPGSCCQRSEQSARESLTVSPPKGKVSLGIGVMSKRIGTPLPRNGSAMLSEPLPPLRLGSSVAISATLEGLGYRLWPSFSGLWMVSLLWWHGAGLLVSIFGPLGIPPFLSLTADGSTSRPPRCASLARYACSACWPGLADGLTALVPRLSCPAYAQ
jgi:hypothetical protein